MLEGMSNMAYTKRKGLSGVMTGEAFFRTSILNNRYTAIFTDSTAPICIDFDESIIHHC